MRVNTSREIVRTACELHAWCIDREIEGRRTLPVAHNIPDGIVEALNEIDVCAIDAVHETCSCANNDGLCISRWCAIEAAEGVAVPEEEGILVVSRGAELVSACHWGAVEALVDDGEVICVDDHTTVGGAGPANEVGRGGQRRVRVNAGQTIRIHVLREVGLVREGRV